MLRKRGSFLRFLRGVREIFQVRWKIYTPEHLLADIFIHIELAHSHHLMVQYLSDNAQYLLCKYVDLITTQCIPT